MEPRDWSLVIFTVLSQAAVGAFFVLLALGRQPDRDEPGPSLAGRIGPLGAIFGVFAASLLVAPFHLSAPLQAPLALVNVGASWLSREILFGMLFAIGLVPLAVAEWQAVRISAWHRVVMGLTAAAGVSFLYCQIMIYMLPAQPAWNSAATPAAFTATTVRLGLLGVAAALVARSDRAVKTFRWLALAGLLMLGTETLVVGVQLASLAGDVSAAAAASATRLTDDYGSVWASRLVLLFVAAAGLGGALASSQTADRSRLVARLTYAALGLVLVSELCGRFLFYATRVRIGI